MKNSSFKEHFFVAVRSGTALLSVDTVEVDRATAELKKLTSELCEKVKAEDNTAEETLKENGYSFGVWDILNGWKMQDGGIIRNTTNIKNAVQHLMKDDVNPGIYVMQNMHLLWEAGGDSQKATFIHLFKDFVAYARERYKNIIFVGDSSKIPNELKDNILYMSFDLPDREELFEFADNFLRDENEDGTKGKRKFKKSIMEDVADIAVGMTTAQLENALSISLMSSNGKNLDREIIFEEKARAVKASGSVEHIVTEENIDTVAGLDLLKEDVQMTAEIFDNPRKAEKYGLRFPKGVLLCGLPGTGKTLSGKVIANILNVPLYRCDLGKVFGGLVGASEANTRELLKLMSALAPCTVIWDECEKMLSGTGSSDRTDSGVTNRVTSQLLYWLQEKTEPVYIVGTMNNIDIGLTSAHIRSGRFDSIWYVGMPSAEERKEGIEIHIKKTGRNPEDYDVKTLANASDGYTVAEIETAIREKAMKKAFKEDREYTTEDIQWGLSQVTPISKVKKDDIQKFEKWAQESGAKPASSVGSKKLTEAWNTPSEGKKRRMIYKKDS